MIAYGSVPLFECEQSPGRLLLFTRLVEYKAKFTEEPFIGQVSNRVSSEKSFVSGSLLTYQLEVLQVETELKSRSSAYYSLKANLEHNEKPQNRLNGIVRKEDFVVSEYLTTLLVVVKRYLQWERSYESLSPFVVPRSSRKLYEDGKGGVYSVTLFKRVVYEFKAKALESKFTVWEICFDQEEMKKQEIMEYTILKKEQYLKSLFFEQEIFVGWLMVNFNQLFIAWIHLKAIRVFVESVLRYGLPVNFQAFLLQTDTKDSKKLRESLSSLFMHLDPTASLKYVRDYFPS
uniref:V-type proton ATPase subunit C n=1 Tax=Oryzias melastigma TaxID=30732 RepID=A0A3B3DBA0_ORYME